SGLGDSVTQKGVGDLAAALLGPCGEEVDEVGEASRRTSRHRSPEVFHKRPAANRVYRGGLPDLSAGGAVQLQALLATACLIWLSTMPRSVSALNSLSSSPSWCMKEAGFGTSSPHVCFSSKSR